jgi:dehydrogenase/reductase SDR family protein 12
MRLQEQRWVDNSLQQAFEYTADFSNIHEWDPGVETSHKAGNGPVGVGAKYDLELRFGVSTVPMVYEITEYEAPNRVVLVGKGENLHAIDEIRFSAQDNMTRIDYTADLEFQGLMKYLVPVLSPIVRRVGTRALDGLVEALRR